MAVSIPLSYLLIVVIGVGVAAILVLHMLGLVHDIALTRTVVLQYYKVYATSVSGFNHYTVSATLYTHKPAALCNVTVVLTPVGSPGEPVEGVAVITPCGSEANITVDGAPFGWLHVSGSCVRSDGPWSLSLTVIVPGGYQVESLMLKACLYTPFYVGDVLGEIVIPVEPVAVRTP